jgi:hypothetical protein
MTDEEYIFRTECAEKKRTARGSFNRLSHAGKGGRVKMPSDYMTKKERDKMNGEVQSYNLNSPMKWTQFKRMPDDIKREYINSLIEKFDPQQIAIAEMLGVSTWTLSNLCREQLGISFERGGAHGEGRNAAFWAWVNGATEAEQEAAPETDEKPAQKPQGGAEVPESGTLVFSDTTAQDAFNAAYALLTTAAMRRVVISWEAAHE